MKKYEFTKTILGVKRSVNQQLNGFTHSQHSHAQKFCRIVLWYELRQNRKKYGYQQNSPVPQPKT